MFADIFARANLVFRSLAGFAFARMMFRGRTVVFGLVLVVLMVRAQSQIVPVFVIIQHIPFAGGNDGAGWFTVYWRIVLPLARPALATLAVLSFQNAWNDFVWPPILTSDSSKSTLQLRLRLYQSGPDTKTNLLLAASLLTVLPMIVLFVVAQRYFAGSLAGAGVKG